MKETGDYTGRRAAFPPVCGVKKRDVARPDAVA